MMSARPIPWNFARRQLPARGASVWYLRGLDFTIALMKAGGKQKAFEGAFVNPPQTTRQIMEPATYLAGEKLAPMPLPNFERDFRSTSAMTLAQSGSLI
jgi:hypothetical protein